MYRINESQWDSHKSAVYTLSNCFGLIDLLQYQYEKIDFIDQPVEVGFDCPLDLHCTYTRDQLLVAIVDIVAHKIQMVVLIVQSVGKDCLLKAEAK